MEHTSFITAGTRLQKAEAAFERVKSSTHFLEFEPAWTDFLIALNGVWEQLFIGTKRNARSRQWYGAKSKLRRKDPLLKYVHQSRNAFEHGSDLVASQRFPSVTFGTPGQMTHFKGTMRVLQGIVTYEPASGETMPEITHTPAHIALVRVFDKLHDDWFDPPTEHLGSALIDASPHTVGTLALEFHRLLIDQAAKFVS